MRGDNTAIVKQTTTVARSNAHNFPFRLPFSLLYRKTSKYKKYKWSRKCEDREGYSITFRVVLFFLLICSIVVLFAGWSDVPRTSSPNRELCALLAFKGTLSGRFIWGILWIPSQWNLASLVKLEIPPTYRAKLNLRKTFAKIVLES